MATEIINVNPDNKQEDPNHVQDMIDAVDSNKDTTEIIKETQQETLIAGKYKTEEDLNKGILELLKRGDKSLEDVYKELEADLGKPPKEDQKDTDKTDDTKTDEPKSLEIPTDNKEVEDKVKDKGLDINEFINEYMQDGDLSKESYKKLEKAGLSKDFVGAYIEGQKAIADKARTEVFTICGGEADYMEMLKWAGENLTDSEKNIFNTTINQGVDQAKFAVEALYSKYNKANGSPPSSLIQGSAKGGTQGDVYESQAQLIKDMGDPRYESDPAFRKKVTEKLGRSQIL